MTDYMKEAFETWFNHQIWGNEDFKTCLSEAWQAALLAHIQRGVLEGWKEATIAWEVCASIHREYAKKKDPFFTTRQADFVRHTEAARAAMLAAAPAPDHFRDAAKMVAAPAEVPMPEPDATLHDDGYYVARHSIRSSYEFNRAGWRLDVLSLATVRTYGAACRAAGEAAGYARGLADAGRDAERRGQFLVECNDVALRIDPFGYGIYDAIDGDGQPYQSQALADEIAALRGEVKP